MAIRCYFLAKETSCGLIVQQVFYFSTCFHPLTKLKISYKCSETYLIKGSGKVQECMRSVR